MLVYRVVEFEVQAFSLLSYKILQCFVRRAGVARTT